MTLEKAGCREDCFHCPYPDCVVSNTHESQEKRRKHSANYDAAHREERLNYFRAYYTDHKEAKNDYSRKHYAAYPEEYKEFLKAYWRRRNKKRYDRLKAAGICVRCMKRPAVPGMIRCEACREADNIRHVRIGGRNEREKSPAGDQGIYGGKPGRELADNGGGIQGDQLP